MSSFINTSLFPSITATSGFRDWLEEVVKYADVEDFDPILKPHKTPNGYVNDDGTPYQEFDYNQLLPDFETLSGIGDARFSLGHIVSSVFDKFQAKIELYTEIAQAGGCQIIDEFICDETGIPIKKSSYNCPENIIVSPIEPIEVVNFVTSIYAQKVEEDIVAFHAFITQSYANIGYAVDLVYVSELPYFIFVKVTKGSSREYIRYYYNDRERLSQIFNKPLTAEPINTDIVAATTNQIPVYNKNI